MKRYRKYAVTIVLGVAVFFGAGIYAVEQGQARNEAICRAVDGLRSDLITAIKTLRQRSINRTPEREQQIREGYEPLLTSIDDRSCP